MSIEGKKGTACKGQEGQVEGWILSMGSINALIPYHSLTDDELHVLPVTAILIAIR